MRVLITNNTLGRRAGSELYVRDIALELLRRGHHPVAYSTQLGAVADELRAATIPVIDDLSLLKVIPDVIHGQHHLDAMTALLHFPDTPAVYFCHGWMPWEEMPAHFPTIQRYVAVDDLCLERLQCVHGIDPERIRVIRNFVDLQRFPLRDDLPRTPRRALAFSNYLREEGALGILRKACTARGIELDAVGISVGRIEDRPEQILAQYDIVFAKARCALEALATGTAVIACDASGLGGMVTPDNYEHFRRLNFGIRSLRDPITVETISRELDRYDAARSHEVSLRVRAEAGIEQAVDQILAVYQEAIASSANLPQTKEPHLQAASVYLRQIAEFTKGRYAAEEARTLAQNESTALRLRAEQAEQALIPTEVAKSHAEKSLTLIHSSRLWPVIAGAFRLADAIRNRFGIST